MLNHQQNQNYGKSTEAEPQEATSSCLAEPLLRACDVATKRALTLFSFVAIRKDDEGDEKLNQKNKDSSSVLVVVVHGRIFKERIELIIFCSWPNFQELEPPRNPERFTPLDKSN